MALPLDDETVRRIQRIWHNRPTVAGLAKAFGTTPSIIRIIISLPYKEDDNDN